MKQKRFGKRSPNAGCSGVVAIPTTLAPDSAPVNESLACMDKVKITAERESVVDHRVAGVLSAVAMLITAALAPIAVAVHSFGSGRKAFELYHGFYIWASALAVTAFIGGVVFGPKRMASVFGHLWGTEEPPNQRVSGALWLAVAAIVCMSWWLS